MHAAYRQSHDVNCLLDIWIPIRYTRQSTKFPLLHIKRGTFNPINFLLWRWIIFNYRRKMELLLSTLRIISKLFTWDVDDSVFENITDMYTRHCLSKTLLPATQQVRGISDFVPKNKPKLNIHYFWKTIRVILFCIY